MQDYLQASGNELSQEDLCVVLEQLSSFAKDSESKTICLLRDRTMEAIFAKSLSELPPIYIGSLIDSMVQLEKVSSLDKALWRRIESHLARKDFLESVNDLGLIALILKRYVHLPHALRELAIEEVFEKAELHIITIFDRMLSQKKLAEDVGFDAHDFSTLI